MRVVLDPADPTKVQAHLPFLCGGVPGDTCKPTGPVPPVQQVAEYRGELRKGEQGLAVWLLPCKAAVTVLGGLAGTKPKLSSRKLACLAGSRGPSPFTAGGGGSSSTSAGGRRPSPWHQNLPRHCTFSSIPYRPACGRGAAARWQHAGQRRCGGHGVPYCLLPAHQVPEAWGLECGWPCHARSDRCKGRC